MSGKDGRAGGVMEIPGLPATAPVLAGPVLPLGVRWWWWWGS